MRSFLERARKINQLLQKSEKWGILTYLCCLVIALITIPYLIYKLDPPEMTKRPEAKEMARQELTKMRALSLQEKIIAGVFCRALLLWSTSQFTKLMQQSWL